MCDVDYIVFLALQTSCNGLNIYVWLFFYYIIGPLFGRAFKVRTAFVGRLIILG